MIETKERRAQAILVYVFPDKEDVSVLEELSLLAVSADYDVVGKMTQHKDKPDKSYYIGTGKLEELKQEYVEIIDRLE